MWLLFEGHGLGCLWADGRFDYFPPHDDAPLQSSFPRMVFDARGRLLIGTFDGLIYREPDGRMHRAPAAFGFPPGLAWPYRATDGTMWVVAGDQLYRLQGERAELVHPVRGQGHFTAMLQGRHGDLWLGSENQGLLRIGPYGVEHLPAGRPVAACRPGASSACARTPKAVSGSAPTAVCSGYARHCSAAKASAMDQAATTAAPCWKTATAVCGSPEPPAWTGCCRTGASCRYRWSHHPGDASRYSAWRWTGAAIFGWAPMPMAYSYCAMGACCATTARPRAFPAGISVRS